MITEQAKTNHQTGLGIGNYDDSRRLYPLLKWAGGKEQELKYIIPNLPEKFVDYYEPFVGGGAVYTAIQAGNYYINDKSEELISLYHSIKNGDRQVFFKALDEIIYNWDLLTTVIENNATFFIQTYKNFSQDKIDDPKLKDSLFEFILSHSDQFNGMFSTMFNFNIENLDFESFFEKHRPKKNDFVFLDPPYDSEFSTYAKNEFTKADQKRLADYLINKCKAKWMMIIKNTDFIFSLYDNKGLKIQSFDKKYLVSFMNRNNKNVRHLIITNY